MRGEAHLLSSICNLRVDCHIDVSTSQTTQSADRAARRTSKIEDAIVSHPCPESRIPTLLGEASAGHIGVTVWMLQFAR